MGVDLSRLSELGCVPGVRDCGQSPPSDTACARMPSRSRPLTCGYPVDDTAASDFTQLLDKIGFAPLLVGHLHDGGRLMQLGGVLSASWFHR